MSGSYFESLGRGSLAPPASDTLQGQFEEDQPNLTDNVNKGIDEVQQANEKTIDGYINLYNTLFDKQKKRPQELLKMTKQGISDADEVKKWYKAEVDYNKYASLFSDKKNKSVVHGQNWMSYRAVSKQDPDVAREYEVENQRLAVQSDSNDIAGEILSQSDGDTATVDVMVNGVGGQYAFEHESNYTIKDVLNKFPMYRAAAEGGMLIELPEHIAPRNPDGTLQRKLYSQAVGEKERRFIDQRIDNWYAFQNRGIVGGRFGRFKREFLTELQKKRDLRTVAYMKEAGAALKSSLQERRFKDLAIKLKTDPGYFVKSINLYKGFHDGRADLARIEAYQNVGDAYKTDMLDRSDVEEMLDTPFLANDSTPENPHWVTPEDYWQKESAALLKVVRDHDNAKREEDEDEAEAKQGLFIDNAFRDIENNKEPISYKAKQDLIQNFMEEFGVSYEEVPDRLKNLITKGSVMDETIDEDLKRRLNRGEKLTRADLVGIEDPDLKAEWIKKLPNSGIDATSRDSFIKGAVNKKTIENDANKDKTLKWRAYEQNATNAFDNAYSSAIATGSNHAQAMTAGREAVLAGLDIGKPGDTSWSQWGGDVQPTDRLKELEAVKNALSLDPALLDSDKFWLGEEPHIQEALKYINGKKLNIPNYYRSFPGVKLSPIQLMRRRLKALDLLPKEVSELPEEQNLPLVNQQRLLTYRPSPARTMQVALENDNANWMFTDTDLAMNTLRYNAQTSQQYNTYDSDYRSLAEFEPQIIDEYVAINNVTHWSNRPENISSAVLREWITETLLA